MRLAEQTDANFKKINDLSTATTAAIASVEASLKGVINQKLDQVREIVMDV